MNILGIIPARYASSRFPGKPLVEINGRSMILRVCDRAYQSEVFRDIIVATDDERILEHVFSAGYHAVMTSSAHASGTDRCLEAMEIFEKEQGKRFGHIINIQGDEPYIHPEQIRKVAAILGSGAAPIATLVKLITRNEDIFNPNVVKAIFNDKLIALYFSRLPIPYIRGLAETDWADKRIHYKHLGIYGFKSETLRTVCRLPEGVLEKNESLEQLRWLENGFKIKIDVTDLESVAIDTPDDLLKITNIT